MPNQVISIDELKIVFNEKGKLSEFFIKNFLQAGKAFDENFKIEDADPKELEMGIKVEYEHTKSTFIATKICIDHLSECRDYYTRLAKMEEEAKEYWSKQGKLL